MPLYKSITVNSQTAVKVWRIEESYAKLIEPLNLKPESLERVLNMKSELHQRGFLSVRHLLRNFGYTDQDLFYDSYGKPHLKDGKHISITHSFEYSGVIISDKPVGIDIEKQRPKIEIIAKKFVNYEFNYLNGNSPNYMRKLTVIWCVKESLYKLFATPGMLFKEHFMVIPFMLSDEQTVAWIDFQSKKYRYNTAFFEFDGFTCAYVIPDE
ncbi:4'-phosphopantetheinyl transferase family protein [Winogradskyella aurantia]|uniref:4-phosphopantetheinyl transferase n=1 Tax=Winogradskyella aurantia TaxID=1915063 RepID=A0A265UZH0_9FLAO|nr:4'-phosphopantetheinyl transferase superfamily protein [Winogradskyella aurantia]OZV70622.1 4-phosphopantetheinyl transferase [Winogradskyella aurantia]